MKRVKNKLDKFFLSSNDPDFLIIGAQKCGTTSLHYYLDQHPDIKGTSPKEIHYFDRDIHNSKSHDEYKSHFKGSNYSCYFESSPSYIYSPDTPKNIYSFYPHLNFIVILRDPVKRAYSAWNHYRDMFESDLSIEMKHKFRREGNLLYDKFFNNRKSFPSFRECIEIELELIDKKIGFEPAILQRGLYLEQLEIYWQYFDKDQLMIIGFKDFVSDVKGTLKKVEDFVGVENYHWDNLKDEPRNKLAYKDPIKDEDRTFLESYFAKPNAALFDVIGKVNW